MDFDLIKKKVFDICGVNIKKNIFFKYYLPLVEYYIEDKDKADIKSYVIGLAGVPGSGKSILSVIIKVILEEKDFSVETFSIDDFYKKKYEREKLIKSGNPFYNVSRGLFGTHDIEKLKIVLKDIKAGRDFNLPVFDKSLLAGFGDIKEYRKIKGKKDFVIFDGWCIGIESISYNQFKEIVFSNKYSKKVFLEMDIHRDSAEKVLEELKRYQELWEFLDNKTIILGRKLERIKQWREEQEKKTIEEKGSGMNKKEIDEFIKPYIPFCVFYYSDMIEEYDCKMYLKKNHLPYSLETF